MKLYRLELPGRAGVVFFTEATPVVVAAHPQGVLGRCFFSLGAAAFELPCTREAAAALLFAAQPLEAPPEAPPEGEGRPTLGLVR